VSVSPPSRAIEAAVKLKPLKEGEAYAITAF
jgi:hypothetical protein